jgi:hypothetical protein
MIQCRWAPSLGELEGTAEEVWGTSPYKNRKDPTVFFGLYDLRDYLALNLHRGKRWILWAGSDIKNLQQGFLFNNGKLKKLSQLFSEFPLNLAEWINKNAESWCENEVEREALAACGIVSQVCPSYMGQIPEVSYDPPSRRADVYLSASPGRQEEYGWSTIDRIAPFVELTKFHLYGAPWEQKAKNIVVHGRVPKEQMNEEIKHMHCGLRLNLFDGFSEITAKSVLMGQYPISRIEYPLIPSFKDEADLIARLLQLRKPNHPNLEAREYYIKAVNNFPWNETKNN